MAKFVYSMESILNIKVRMEDQAKAFFAEKAKALRDEEDKLQAIYDKIQSLKDETREKSMDTLNILELKSLRDAIEYKKDEAKKQMVMVNIARKNLELARKKLDDAIKERKIHEKLKEKQFEEFVEELNRQEAKEIDELVNYKFTSNS